MKKSKWMRAAVLLLTGLVLLSLFAPAALAGEDLNTGDVPNAGGDMEPEPPGTVVPPDPPVTEPPVSEPPVYSEPPATSDLPPESSPPESSSPSSQLPEPSDPIYSEPVPEEPGPGIGNGVVEQPTTPRQTPKPTPRSSSSSASSRPQIERPQLSLGTGSSSAAPSSPAEDSGPNYVTFARVNQRHNSMSLTLFYGGAGSILVGVIGLGLILAFYFHGRRVDERDGIFEEIAQAEQRSPQAYPPHQPRPAPPQPPAVGEGYAAAAPAQDSLYTEEFEVPAQQPSQQGYAAPAQDSLYTGEFEVPVQQPGQQGHAAPAPQAPAPAPAASYDTEEILRELLNKP